MRRGEALKRDGIRIPHATCSIPLGPAISRKWVQTLVLAALRVVRYGLLLTWEVDRTRSALLAVPLQGGFDTARGALADGVVAGRRARICR